MNFGSFSFSPLNFFFVRCVLATLSGGMPVRQLVRLSHTSRTSEKSNILTKMEQKSIENMELYHLKDNSWTSMRADRQIASDV